ncbi:MAG: M23 family metallopeptidase, partial [Actinomycetes bacterium]
PTVVIVPAALLASASAAAEVMCLPSAAADTTEPAAATLTASDLAPFTTAPLGAALAALPKAHNSESKLAGNTVLMLRLIEHLWPYYGKAGVIYGWREDAIADHPSGQALDIMLKSDGRTAASVAEGNEIAAFFIKNAKALGVDYMMFRHRIWQGQDWRQANEAGSWTANHMNHIHLKVFGDHKPSGQLRLPSGTPPIPTPSKPVTTGKPQVAAPTPTAPADDSVVWPVGRGEMGELHPTGARDMSRALGTPVVAAHAGTVSVSQDTPPEIPLPAGKHDGGGYGFYGRQIVITWKTATGTAMGNLYAHLRTRSVSVGDRVQAGQLVGYVGSTGNSSGPHLHFELFSSGVRAYDGTGERVGLDPAPWLKDGKNPAIDGVPTDPGGQVTAAECEAAGGSSVALPEFGGSGPYSDNPVPVRTHGTTYTGLQAAQRLVKWAADPRTNPYDGLCLGLADDAYAPTGSRVPRAIDQWYRALAHGYAHPRDRTPPVGAQLFWWSQNDARHIATYVGGGKVVSNMPGGVKVVNASELDSWGPYLGWADPYYG